LGLLKRCQNEIYPAPFSVDGPSKHVIEICKDWIINQSWLCSFRHESEVLLLLQNNAHFLRVLYHTGYFKQSYTVPHKLLTLFFFSASLLGCISYKSHVQESVSPTNSEATSAHITVHAESYMTGQLLFSRWHIATLMTTALVRKNCAFEHLITTVSNLDSAACQRTGAGKTVALYILEVTNKHRTRFNLMQFTAHRERNHALLSVHTTVFRNPFV
jgi:hypothetical protein